MEKKLKMGLDGADLSRLEFAEPLGDGYYVLTFRDGYHIHTKNIRLRDCTDEERAKLAKFYLL